MSEIERPDRAIPANIEAERAVLGSLMIDPDAIIKVANYLRPEDFFRERHAWLYEAMRTLNERREPLDFVTIVDELERRERLEEIGGPAYLTDLIASTPTALYVDHYARIVERTAVLRRLIAAAGKIAELAYDESQEVDEVVDRAEQIIFGISESRIHRDLTPIRAIMSRVVDRIDFLSRNQDTLMGVPTGFTMLDRLLGGLQKSDLVILAARPAMGKCVASGTRLLHPQTGQLVPIEALVQARRAPLLTLNAQYKLEASVASDFIDDGIKPVYLVRTALGREIQVTLTHPFLTIHGWRPLGELRVGDIIAVPRTLPVFGTYDAPEHEAKLLGYFLADGCLCHTNPQFTNSNPRLRADFTEAVTHFPSAKVRYEDSKGQRTPTLYVSSDRDRIRRERNDLAQLLTQQLAQRDLSISAMAKMIGIDHAIIRFWLKGKTVPSATIYPKVAQLLQITPEQLPVGGLASLRSESQNSVTRWLQQQGIWGKGAREKFVPEAVFTYTRTKLALFLNRLFACDGSLYIQNQNQAGIAYSTVSKQLAHDVQHLLLRFGIIAKLRHRQVKYKGGSRSAYELRITDTNSIQQFCTEIGAFGKEEALTRVLTQAQSTNGHVNRDLIPIPIWEQILAHKGEQGWRTIYQQMELSPEHNLHVGKRALSRRRLRQLGEALAAPALITLAESDLYWDQITAIEYVGEQQVYDLTVPETHNFIADDMLVHNTSFCLSIAQNAAKRHATRVAFFSLEMSNDQLVQRLLAMETGIDSHRLRLGTIHEEEWPILLEAANMLANTRIFIDDTPAASVNDIRTKARRLYAEDGLDLIIIDYMQLMTGQSGGNGRNENRQQEISYISRSLKTLARELNVPVIALSQLSRAVESRSDKRPMLSDLRESGSIEQDADVVLFIYREDYYIEDTDRQNIADILVAKHRHGATGTVSLYFRKELTQFRDLEIQRTELEY